MLRAILSRSSGMRRGVLAPCFSAQYEFSTHNNTKYNNPKGVPTLRQKRIASEVKEVISEALQQGPCQNPVLQRAGFEVKDVKMSSDLRTAHVLWRALPGMQKNAERAVLVNVKRLRSLVFSRLSLPFSPVIKLQEDTLPPKVQALEEAFARLRESEEEIQEENSASEEGSAFVGQRPQDEDCYDDLKEKSQGVEEGSPVSAP
ncbi:hypothetical protein Mapa_015469 [Marchantia paleacea]|nr:hypothetical protein Mapa_015469 [Marchantia paleacea]